MGTRPGPASAGTKPGDLLARARPLQPAASTPPNLRFRGDPGQAHPKVRLELDLFSFLLVALVQEADEVLGAGERLPALREEILRQDVAVRQLVDGDAPLLKGARDLHLEIVLGGGVAHDLVVVVEPSLS